MVWTIETDQLDMNNFTVILCFYSHDAFLSLEYMFLLLTGAAIAIKSK